MLPMDNVTVFRAFLVWLSSLINHSLLQSVMVICLDCSTVVSCEKRFFPQRLMEASVEGRTMN